MRGCSGKNFLHVNFSEMLCEPVCIGQLVSPILRSWWVFVQHCNICIALVLQSVVSITHQESSPYSRVSMHEMLSTRLLISLRLDFRAPLLSTEADPAPNC